ncbi:Phytochrome-like protein cph2 [compost metagenome]
MTLSPLCLQDPRFARRVAVMLRGWDLPPACLTFELTPTDLPEARDGITANVERLRAMGVQILLDRFGHGLSGLDRLQWLPVDGLKLDPSLTRGFPENAVKRGIMEGVLAMAKALGCRAIATGIDSEADFTHLAQAGFDALQGDWLGRPLPADAFASRWLSPNA